jgi:hypothetical protein
VAIREVVLDSSTASVLSVIRGQIEKRQEQCDEGGPMPQISTQEFERLPLRVHDFLAGVPLHDVWAVDLPRARSDHAG